MHIVLIPRGYFDECRIFYISFSYAPIRKQKRDICGQEIVAANPNS